MSTFQIELSDSEYSLISTFDSCVQNICSSPIKIALTSATEAPDIETKSFFILAPYKFICLGQPPLEGNIFGCALEGLSGTIAESAGDTVGWILATGIWDDSGEWDDNSLWID